MSRGYFRPDSVSGGASITDDDADVASGQRNVVSITVTAQGTATVADRVHAYFTHIQDRSGVVNKTITGAANNGSGLIRITATSHGFTTGDHIAVYGVGGTTEANGAWVITVITANTFDLVGSTFTNAYTSGGTATNRPMMYGYTVYVKPKLTRAGLTGTAANADDVNGFVAWNSDSSTQSRATDAFYLGHNSTFTAAQAEWATAFASAGHVLQAAFKFSGSITGTASADCAIFDAGSATINADAFAMRVPNNGVFAARNAANNANVNMFRLNTSDRFQIDAPTTMVTGTSSIALVIQDVTTNSNDKLALVADAHYTNSEEPLLLIRGLSQTASSIVSIGGGIATCNAATGLTFYTAANNTTTTGTLRLTIGSTGTFTFADGAANLAFGSTTGSKIGTSTSDKIAFWNKTPIVQPTTAISGAAFTANSGTAVNDASTFGGYTLAKIAAALINTGILA